MATIKVRLYDGSVFFFKQCEYWIAANRTALIFKPTGGAVIRGHTPGCVATYNRDVWRYIEAIEDKEE